MASTQGLCLEAALTFTAATASAHLLLSLAIILFFGSLYITCILCYCVLLVVIAINWGMFRKLESDTLFLGCSVKVLKNGDFTSENAQNAFRPHHVDGILKRNNHFGFRIEENWSRKSHDFHDTIVFLKLRFQNVFRPHKMRSRRFQIPPVWRAFFGKLCFRDGLVWTLPKLHCTFRRKINNIVYLSDMWFQLLDSGLAWLQFNQILTRDVK